MDKPVGILYEHPLWFQPLFAELERRGIPYEAVNAASHTFDPTEPDSPYSLLVNRMSPSAWTRGHARPRRRAHPVHEQRVRAVGLRRIERVRCGVDGLVRDPATLELREQRL